MKNKIGTDITWRLGRNYNLANDCFCCCCCCLIYKSLFCSEFTAVSQSFATNRHKKRKLSENNSNDANSKTNEIFRKINWYTFVYKNVVFLAEVGYSYFSVDFSRLKIFFWIILHYNVWYFCSNVFVGWIVLKKFWSQPRLLYRRHHITYD